MHGPLDATDAIVLEQRIDDQKNALAVLFGSQPL